MMRKMMDYLCCPVCKGVLTVDVESESQEEILSGKLVCTKCNELYPIQNGIPDMLTPELRALSQR